MCSLRRSAVPYTPEAKKYFKKLACFSAPGNTHPKHHVYHAIHHNFTTKTPPAAHRVSKTTLKNTSKLGFYSPATAPSIFSENQTKFLEI
jgi:hypothetical protein